MQRIRREGSRLWFVTQGDANNTFEHWRIAADGQLGRVVYVVPWVGHLAVLTQTPLGLALLVIVPVLLSDGESNWFQGVQLIALYVILGVVFYFA